MGDYFEFAAGLGWTKVFGNGGRFGPGIPRDTPVSPRGGGTSTGVDSAGPIPCNTVRSHQIPSDPTRSQNFLPDPASSRSNRGIPIGGASLDSERGRDIAPRTGAAGAFVVSRHGRIRS